jgi:hypothetical protein
VQAALPIIETGAAIFAPSAAAALTPFLPIFNAVVSAVDTIAADTGKDFATVVQDVIAHLTPGQPNAPALAPASSS